MCTASKGRTHGCNDQCCKTVKKALAKPEPSTHGNFRTRQARLPTPVLEGTADIAGHVINSTNVEFSISNLMRDAHAEAVCPDG
jgi:hypothetical protein